MLDFVSVLTATPLLVPFGTLNSRGCHVPDALSDLPCYKFGLLQLREIAAGALSSRIVDDSSRVGVYLLNRRKQIFMRISIFKIATLISAKRYSEFPTVVFHEHVSISYNRRRRFRITYGGSADLMKSRARWKYEYALMYDRKSNVSLIGNRKIPEFIYISLIKYSKLLLQHLNPFDLTSTDSKHQVYSVLCK